MKEVFKQTVLGKLMSKPKQTLQPQLYNSNREEKKKNIAQPQNETWKTFITEPAEDSLPDS